MLKSQFDYLCENFGDPSIPAGDRWKSIRYLFIENPLMDVQFLLKRHEIMYIDSASIGAGFYIMGTPNADIEPVNKGSVITFIPLSMVDKISFNTDFIEPVNNISQVNRPVFNDDNPIIEGVSFDTESNNFSTIIE